MPRRPTGPHLATVPGRAKWYVVWTDDDRRTHRRSTGVPVADGCRDPARAPLAAQQALDAFVEALSAPGPETTVADLLERRLDDLRARLDPHDHDGAKSRLPSYKYASEHKFIRAELGHLPAAQLSKQRLVRFGRAHHWRRKVSKAFRELRAAYHLAGLTPPEFPSVPRRPPRDRFITQDEARRLIEAAPYQHVQVFLTLAFLSGQRRGAILDLTWDRVDLRSGVADFNDPNRPITDKRRTAVALDRRALALLREAAQVAQTDYVVEWRGRRVHDVKNAWRATCVAAGLAAPKLNDRGQPVTDRSGNPVLMPLYTVHHIKHSVISWLAEAGWDIDRISDFTDTSRETVRRVYRKVRPEAMAGMSTTLGDGLYGTTPALQEVK